MMKKKKKKEKKTKNKKKEQAGVTQEVNTLEKKLER